MDDCIRLISKARQQMPKATEMMYNIILSVIASGHTVFPTAAHALAIIQPQWPSESASPLDKHRLVHLPGSGFRAVATSLSSGETPLMVFHYFNQSTAYVLLAGVVEVINSDGSEIRPQN